MNSRFINILAATILFATGSFAQSTDQGKLGLVLQVSGDNQAPVIGVGNINEQLLRMEQKLDRILMHMAPANRDSQVSVEISQVNLEVFSAALTEYSRAYSVDLDAIDELTASSRKAVANANNCTRISSDVNSQCNAKATEYYRRSYVVDADAITRISASCATIKYSCRL